MKTFDEWFSEFRNAVWAARPDLEISVRRLLNHTGRYTVSADNLAPDTANRRKHSVYVCDPTMQSAAMLAKYVIRAMGVSEQTTNHEEFATGMGWRDTPVATEEPRA